MRSTMTDLTICGIEELETHRTRGVSHVLSILDPGVPDPAAFGRYDPHHRLTLRFHDAIEPEPDLELPDAEDVDAILAFGRAIAAEEGEGGHLLIHCHMGISRSTAAMAMLLAQAQPEEDERAIADRILELRPVAWPNSLMIQLADDSLGRGGRLVDACARLYARGLAARPDLAEIMVRINLRHEVDLGRRHLPR